MVFWLLGVAEKTIAGSVISVFKVFPWQVVFVVLLYYQRVQSNNQLKKGDFKKMAYEPHIICDDQDFLSFNQFCGKIKECFQEVTMSKGILIELPEGARKPKQIIWPLSVLTTVYQLQKRSVVTSHPRLHSFESENWTTHQLCQRRVLSWMAFQNPSTYRIRRARI